VTHRNGRNADGTYLPALGRRTEGDVKSPGEDHVEQIDRWFPEKAPEGATLLATSDIAEEAEVFHKVYEVKVKIGPIRATLGIDVKFKGKVEYWQAQ
jgi:hypothetical protein